jgi:phosphoribosylformylglycinamidine synthase
VKATVYVTVKQGVLDPQGKAVQQALVSLGFSFVKDVRQGKLIELELSEVTDETESIIEEMCKKLLVNTVIENYRIEVSND